jgi:hypothetical protein
VVRGAQREQEREEPRGEQSRPQALKVSSHHQGPPGEHDGALFPVVVQVVISVRPVAPGVIKVAARLAFRPACEVIERLAEVEDRLQPQPELADHGGVRRLRSAAEAADALVVPGVELAVVHDEKARSLLERVGVVRVTGDKRDVQEGGPGVVGVLKQLFEQGFRSVLLGEKAAEGSDVVERRVNGTRHEAKSPSKGRPSMTTPKRWCAPSVHYGIESVLLYSERKGGKRRSSMRLPAFPFTFGMSNGREGSTSSIVGPQSAGPGCAGVVQVPEPVDSRGYRLDRVKSLIAESRPDIHGIEAGSYCIAGRVMVTSLSNYHE